MAATPFDFASCGCCGRDSSHISHKHQVSPSSTTPPFARHGAGGGPSAAQLDVGGMRCDWRLMWRSQHGNFTERILILTSFLHPSQLQDPMDCVATHTTQSDTLQCSAGHHQVRSRQRASRACITADQPAYHATHFAAHSTLPSRPSAVADNPTTESRRTQRWRVRLRRTTSCMLP